MKTIENKIDENKKNEWFELRRKSFLEIERILKEADIDAQKYLSYFVASICNVEQDDLFTKDKTQQCVFARWLYWYAMRYMYGETYSQIAQRVTVFDGYKFTGNNIGLGISAMTKKIGLEKTWKDKWLVVKRFIDTYKDPMAYHVNDFCNPMPMKYKFTLNVPKGLKDNITIEVKEV